MAGVPGAGSLSACSAFNISSPEATPWGHNAFCVKFRGRVSSGETRHDQVRAGLVKGSFNYASLGRMLFHQTRVALICKATGS